MSESPTQTETTDAESAAIAAAEQAPSSAFSSSTSAKPAKTPRASQRRAQSQPPHRYKVTTQPSAASLTTANVPNPCSPNCVEENTLLSLLLLQLCVTPGPVADFLNQPQYHLQPVKALRDLKATILGTKRVDQRLDIRDDYLTSSYAGVPMESAATFVSRLDKLRTVYSAPVPSLSPLSSTGAPSPAAYVAAARRLSSPSTPT